MKCWPAPLLLACSVAAAAPGAATGPLRVPSPDWRDQVIYFVVTDRFADGDPHNNDQGAGEYRAGDGTRYNGGDLAGLLQHLPYIRGLGATALWITPPVANQWLSPAGDYAGYHGYWAENFMQVDRHLGTLADYQRLARALHGAGMYLVQDIVVNHTGNYFGYRGGWDAGDPARYYVPHTATPPVARPSQPPFDLNDPRDPRQRAQAIYHWTPDITDFSNPDQLLNFQLAGLDDLNTENPRVRRALRRSYDFWIREAGVDAFRVDTAFYVPPAFFDDFLHARDPQAPGIAVAARQTGRKHFLVFGEGFGIDRPGDDTQSRRIEAYMTGADGRPLLPGMLNFPLYGALGDAFARGRPPAALGERIARQSKLFARPQLMPTFVDNHDVDRFLAGGTVAGLEQALLAIMTLPGIPVVYYGTEQGFTVQRAAMFKAGFGSGGRDHYDTAAPLYRRIAAMTALRRAHPVFSRGTPTVLAAEGAQAGALAWRMQDGPASAWVVFNTADHAVLLPGLATGLAEGSVLEGLFGLAGRPADLVVGAQGRVTLRLPPRCGWVWQQRPGAVPAAPAPNGPGAAPAAASITLDALPADAVDGDFEVGGRAPGVQRLQIVVDGDLASATAAVPDAAGRWQARVATGRLADPEVEHSIVAWDGRQAVSQPRRFRVVRHWQLLADVADPAGDDRGPDGRYRYPREGSWDAHQADLRRVQAWGSGGALKLDLTMNAVTAGWGPPNGFDHVVFTIFVALPGRADGATVMPLQNASLPGGMRWQLRLRAGGWSDALFASAGASATDEGTPVTPAAAIAVDRRAGRVSLTIPAAALGNPPSLAGAQVYVTTWDYDGGYRPLAPEAGPFAFGGGAADGPKVMDASAVITLHEGTPAGARP